MIEDQVREALGAMPAAETRSLAEQVDDIAALERVIAMAQAELSDRTVGFVDARRREDLARGASVDEAGRGASAELALARRVSVWTIDNHLGFGACQLGCVNGRVDGSGSLG